VKPPPPAGFHTPALSLFTSLAKKAASDTGALGRFGYGHFGYFKLTRSHCQQSAAANRLARPDSEEDSAAAIKNGFLRIG